MKRLLYASLAACGLTILPLVILRLSFNSAAVSALKWTSTTLLLPGTYLAFVAGGERIDDISFLVADSANFIFYSVLSYVLLAAWEKRRARRSI